MSKFLVACIILGCGLSAFASEEAENKASQRVKAAAEVLDEIQSAPDQGIPEDILGSAECVAVVPSMLNGGFLVGARYGRGIASCRTPKGWSPPVFFSIEGGSFGLQIGGSESDVIMLVMNNRGAEKLLSSKFTLGGEGEVAAGPVGRDATAQTDAMMRAEILSWSRSRGVFAGISLQGATLRQDLDDNGAIYGRKVTNREIVQSSSMPVPNAAQGLVSILNKYSSRK